jgi:acetoin utilization deacetylase AcuC-like enzyme
VDDATTSTVLFVDTPDSDLHQPGPDHPDSPERMEAVRRAAEHVPGLERSEGRLADPTELATVHHGDYVDQITLLSESGGGLVDPDTFVSAGTYRAACGAAGAGLTAIDQLAGRHDLGAAFVATRPPGHHASRDSGAGFCIFNNIAIAAATLLGRGERVAIIDWDAHHGNGTEQIFWNEPDVLYVSIHQEGLYPGTGRPHQRGPAADNLTTVNLPLPAGATGDVYLEAFDTIIEPLVRRFGPSWVLVSTGFDAHTDDPLADMALEAPDFAHMALKVVGWAPAPGGTALFLEGGYDLEALERSLHGVLVALTSGQSPAEGPTGGGPGRMRIAELARLWAR